MISRIDGRRLERQPLQNRIDIQRRLRPTEPEALHEVAALVVQKIHLLRGLDTFGDDIHIQPSPQADDGAADRLEALIVRRPGNKALVDLDNVQRVAMQIPERREAGTKVIQRNANPHALQLPQCCQGIGDVAHQQALGDFQHQAGRRQPGFPQDLRHPIGEALFLQLPAGQVDRAAQGAEPLLLPLTHLGTGLLQDPFTHLDNLARLFQNRNKFVRRHQPRALPPAQQCFNTDSMGTSGGNLHDGLIEQLELTLRQCLAECVFKIQALIHLFLQRLAVERQLRLAERLGPIQGKIRLAQHILLATMALERSHADTDADRQAPRGRDDRVLQCVHDALRHHFRIAGHGHVIQQHHKFITTKARQVIARAQAALNPLGDLNQHLITDLVSKAVIDQLEAIQVDKQHRRMTCPRLGLTLQRLGQQLADLLPVGQPGQLVMQHHVRQLLLGLLALADIGQRPGQQVLAVQIGGRYATDHYPEQAPPAVTHFALDMQIRLTTIKVRLYRRKEPAALQLGNQGRPVNQGTWSTPRVEPEHGQPALRYMQPIVLDMPLPEPVTGALNSAGIAILTRLQRHLAGTGVGIDGQTEIKEGHLQQTAIELFGQLRFITPLTVDGPMHEIKIEVKGRQIPLEIHAQALMGQPHQQAQTHVLQVIRATQQLPEVGLLLPLQRSQAAGMGKQPGRLVKLFQMLEQRLDAFRMQMIERRQVGAQAVEPGVINQQQAQPLPHLIGVQPKVTLHIQQLLLQVRHVLAPKRARLILGQKEW